MKSQHLRALAVLVFAFGLGACNSVSGLSYRSLTIQSLSTSSPKVTHCTTLPQLIGSEIDDEVVLGDGVVAHVIAMRDDAALSFTGTVGGEADSHTVSEGQLASGFSDHFSVSSRTTQASFDISLASGCPASSGNP